MNQKDCTGQCIAGVIIAIIFGGLFLWTLIDGIGLQWRAQTPFALAEYLLALVFLAIVKAAKWWAMGCNHPMPGSGCRCCWSEPVKAKRKK